MAMKRLVELAKSLTITGWAVVLSCVVVGVYCATLIFGSARSAVNEHKVTQLEAEKQQFLKAGAESHDRELILQGQIKAQDEVIKSLTSQITESNQRVMNAHNETQSARSTVSKVRSDAPHFDSADDAGRIRELSAELHGLYSDPPR